MGDIFQRVPQYTRKLVKKIPLDTGNYPYVCARLKAMKSLLYPPEMYQKFLQMEIPQISRTLGEGQYKEEFIGLGTKHSGVDLIEMATSENLARTYTKILDFSEGHLRTIISKFIDRWDVFNIQTIIRGKFYGATGQEIWEDIVAAGSFTEDFLRDLVEKETIDDIIEALEGTMYYEPLVQTREEHDEMRTGAHFEDALSHCYYANLLDTTEPYNTPNKLFLKFIRMEIDVLNLRTLLRLNLGNAEVGENAFVEGGLELSVEELQIMVEMDWDALLPKLSTYSFYENISGELTKVEEEGLNEVLRSLEKHVLKEASKYANLHPLSIQPVLDFMIAKKNEVDNIRIIARGKESDLENTVIKNLLVM
jgi:V/A-type H+-transporting ATPase subunit C